MADVPKLRLYNTLTRAKEDFVPLDADNVRMYVCGPTVYDFAHIGNARPVIVFDVLYRLLRHLYGEKHVTYVRNITDIDDKINKRAFERWNRTGSLLDEVKSLTQVTAAQYEADVAALGCLPPDHSPRATDFVCDGAQTIDMVRVIEKLVVKGHAYAAEGHVLFHVPSMPNYGKLSRRPLDDMIAGARVEVAPYKKDPMDFVLWKPSDPATEPGWASPWGFGRPGWHIECSAMSGALLGEQFDIHAGGIDLIFPHHENEIAQTCCAYGVDKMASVWMHNGFLQVEGQKMSKSVGNFFTIQDVLKDWKSGEIARLSMLKTHYRQPIDWTERSLEESKRSLHRWRRISLGINPPIYRDPFREPSPDILVFLADDLNTAGALNWMERLAVEAEKGNETSARELIENCHFLGFNFEGIYPQEMVIAAMPDVIDEMITSRLAARAAKNFTESDRIRDELLGMGIQLMDGKDPVTGEPVTAWEMKR
jgi:cysteinyl-tRNA synthetase